jgi:hypothetical protein
MCMFHSDFAYEIHVQISVIMEGELEAVDNLNRISVSFGMGLLKTLFL